MDSWILPKGKYKGTDVYDIAKTDRFYLQWILDTWDLSFEERACIQDALNPSRESLKPAVGQKYVAEPEILKCTDFLIRKARSISTVPEARDLAERSLKEMYRMLTGKDYGNVNIF